MKKFLARGLLALAFMTGLGFAASAQNVDFKVFGVETGIVMGYDITAGSLGNQSSVILNLTLTDSLTAGFGFYTGVASLPTAATVMSLQYGLADRFGMIVSLGRDTSGVANPLLTGVGMYFNIFERKLQDAISTVMKTKIEYVFIPTTGLSSGDLCVSLSIGVGI